MRIQFPFSVISNIRNPIHRSINRRTVTYDSYISRYEDIYIMAYTQKRRLRKEEIPPKIFTQENPISEIERDLSQQLGDGIETIPESVMAMHYEKMEITSAYTFSKFGEKAMRELFESYEQKVLLNGRMPPMGEVEKYNHFLERIIGLYRIFYYGQELSPLEQFIESQYLSLKLNKYNGYLKSGEKSIRKKNQYLKCLWNDENQRSLEGYRNWQSRPFDDYADFRPFFNEVLVMKNTNPQGNEPVLSEKLILSPEEYLNRENVEFLAIQLFNRVLEWCGCLEFNRILKLPADFLIELSIVSIHVWMLVSRLNKEKSSLGLAQSLQRKLKSLVKNKLGEISSETGTSFDEDVYNRFLLHWRALDFHFTQSPNPYLNLGALVQSTVFLSKVNSHSDSITLFSQYLKLNYEAIQSLPIQTILMGNLEFDVYLIPPDYKLNFPRVSPQPYPFPENLRQILEPIQKPNLQLQKPTLGTKIYRWMVILTRGLKSYDYYSEVEKQEKEKESMKSVGWEREKDLDQEFKEAQKLRGRTKK